MKEYLVDIKTPSRFITVKGKRVRTPTRFKIPESQLKALRMTLHHESITDFKIVDCDTIVEESDIESDRDEIFEETEVIIENTFENEPKSTLEKLLKASETEKKE
jgi:hypothetical protein